MLCQRESGRRRTPSLGRSALNLWPRRQTSYSACQRDRRQTCAHLRRIENTQCAVFGCWKLHVRCCHVRLTRYGHWALPTSFAQGCWRCCHINICSQSMSLQAFSLPQRGRLAAAELLPGVCSSPLSDGLVRWHKDRAHGPKPPTRLAHDWQGNVPIRCRLQCSHAGTTGLTDPAPFGNSTFLPGQCSTVLRGQVHSGFVAAARKGVPRAARKGVPPMGAGRPPQCTTHRLRARLLHTTGITAPGRDAWHCICTCSAIVEFVQITTPPRSTSALTMQTPHTCFLFAFTCTRILARPRRGFMRRASRRANSAPHCTFRQRPAQRMHTRANHYRCLKLREPWRSDTQTPLLRLWRPCFCLARAACGATRLSGPVLVKQNPLQEPL